MFLLSFIVSETLYFHPLASSAELRREPEYRRILSEAEKLIPEKIRIELAKEGTL